MKTLVLVIAIGLATWLLIEVTLINERLKEPVALCPNYHILRVHSTVKPIYWDSRVKLDTIPECQSAK